MLLQGRIITEQNWNMTVVELYFCHCSIFMARSSHRRISTKKDVLKISQYSQENTCVGVFFNKVSDLQACNFIKKRLQHRCFPVKFAKFLRTAILKNIYEQQQFYGSPISSQFLISIPPVTCIFDWNGLKLGKS